jgi:hypothetical protein
MQFYINWKVICIPIIYLDIYHNIIVHILNEGKQTVLTKSIKEAGLVVLETTTTEAERTIDGLALF